MRLDSVQSRTEFRRYWYLWADSYVLRSQSEQTGDRTQIFNKRYVTYYVERVNHQDKLAGQTPLYYVKHLDMARLLIEKGADVTITDSQGKTAV